VLVSFTGTAAWDQTSRIQRTLDALADNSCRVLVTASLADVSSIRIPDNAWIVRRLPHGEVLPAVHAMVTHAGHGSVSLALAHGVPLVCLPNWPSDQPMIAAQVETLGAGRALDGETATVEEIAQAVNDVLTNPAYGAAASRLAEEIATTHGAAEATSRLLRLGQAPGQAG